MIVEPDDNVISKVPVHGPRVHPGRLELVRKLEDSISDDKIVVMLQIKEPKAI